MASVAKNVVLSDSLQRTRPTFSTLLTSDVNAGKNAVQQIQQQRQIRQMKFPSMVGRGDVDSFKQVDGPTDFAYKRYNDVGDYRPPAPFRSCDNFIDPVSGFVSVSGDVDRNTGHTQLRSMVQLNHTPQSDTPQAKNSVRVGLATAPPEVLRASENAPGAPYAWNSRKVLDGALRGKLGGWTSAVDPRTVPKQTLRGVDEPTPQVKKVTIKVRLTPKPPKTPADDNRDLRDKLSLRYQYTSSTQRAYEELPWDSMLASKRWPATTTLENRPDMISQRWTLKRYEPRAEEWQATGRSWDWFQKRRGYYKDGPIPGIVFCSSNPRSQQIPGYSGSIGGTNLDEMDNRKEPFAPLTVKRSQIPRYTDTAHRPTIPGFAGSTPQGDADRPLGPMPPAEHVTSSGLYRRMPEPPNTSDHKRESHMSKMVTTVPPYNPFNKVPRPEVTC